MTKRIAVLGAGSWGTALAVLLGQKNYRVNLWARKPELARACQIERTNRHYLPGVIIPPLVQVDDDQERVLAGSDVVVLAVASHSVREVAREIKSYLHNGAIVINTAKGLENSSLLRISQVLQEELMGELSKRIAVLSGPSHAEEVGRGLPTAVVVSAPDIKVAKTVQDIFMASYFRVYTNPDLIGVEIAGALKNIIALGTGIAEGLGYGDNTKAALITRGLAEITRLGLAVGADASTFAGLAGIGDLVVTCTSMHSRNHRAGIQIGQGEPLDRVVANMGMVVEGVNTTRVAYDLTKKYLVEMPIATETFKVLFEGKNAREAVVSLMTRDKSHEGEKEMLNAN
ncbi:MAG: NAD(P)H-dependent glycerol-3-phosphate dehydrogenase [Desulfitobacteriaceae bacterium]|nr:NAD(P)H-dependent glycerol-3-phosphate dehydrogenase [Desulfitobacteriaceae bacterium]